MGTLHPVHQRQLLSPSLTRISTNHEFVSRHHNAVTAERFRLGPRGEYPQARATARSRRNQHALRVAPRRTPTPVLLCYAARVLVPAGEQRNRVALPSGSRRAPFRSGRHRTKRASLSLRSIPVRRDPDRSWTHQRCKGQWIPLQRRERKSPVEHAFGFIPFESHFA